MNEFESQVCSIVRPLLEDREHAGFFGDSGTLFAECSEQTARSIFHTLSGRLGQGKVQVQVTSTGEYAYDFVA